MFPDRRLVRDIASIHTIEIFCSFLTGIFFLKKFIDVNVIADAVVNDVDVVVDAVVVVVDVDAVVVVVDVDAVVVVDDVNLSSSSSLMSTLSLSSMMSILSLSSLMSTLSLSSLMSTLSLSSLMSTCRRRYRHQRHETLSVGIKTFAFSAKKKLQKLKFFRLFIHFFSTSGFSSESFFCVLMRTALIPLFLRQTEMLVRLFE